MRQYVLNGRNGNGQEFRHIEDYRSEEEMRDGLASAEHAFKCNSWFSDVRLEGRRLTAKGKDGKTIEYYITEREIEDWNHTALAHHG